METKPDLRFTVRLKRSGDCDTFRAHVTYKVDPDRNRASDSGIRNPSSWDPEPLKSLSALTISAQRDRNDGQPAWYGYPTWYGFRVEYHDTNADLNQAEAMVKRLRQVQRKLDKHAEKFGHTTDLADFCARVAHALGVEDGSPFGFWQDNLGINGTHYKWYDVTGLRSKLADAV